MCYKCLWAPGLTLYISENSKVTHAFCFGLLRSASADVKSLTSASASADVGKVTSVTSLIEIFSSCLEQFCYYLLLPQRH